MMDIPDNFDHD